MKLRQEKGGFWYKIKKFFGKWLMDRKYFVENFSEVVELLMHENPEKRLNLEDFIWILENFSFSHEETQLNYQDL